MYLGRFGYVLKELLKELRRGLIRIEEVLATLEELMDEGGCVGYEELKKNIGEAIIL